MNHRNLSSAGRARRFRLGAGLLPVLAACAAAASGLPAERSLPGPETHLVRLAVPNRGMAVFLPSSEIASKDGAAAYLAWARETFPAWSGRMKGVWDDEGDSVELRILAEPPELYAELLRKDDEVVDPSGRNVFVVAETPRKGDETVRVRMKSPFGTGEATPKTCITNVWALSRTNLLARWRNALEDGRRAEVRREIDTLERAGRFSASFHDGGAWEDDVAKFALDPRMRARIVFTNESGRTVLLAVEGSTNVISADAASSWGPSGPEGKRRVSWSARDDSDPATADADWDWKRGAVDWLADGEDRFVHIVEPVGTLKEIPSLFLPSDLLSGATGAVATVCYDGAGEEPALAFEPVSGGRLIRVKPGRKVLSVVVSAEGFRSAPFSPRRGAASFVRGADPEPLVGKALRRAPKPWPKTMTIAVDRDGYEGLVWVNLFGIPGREGRFDLSGTNSLVKVDLTDALHRLEDDLETIEASVSVESVEANSASRMIRATISRGDPESRADIRLPRAPRPSVPSALSAVASNPSPVSAPPVAAKPAARSSSQTIAGAVPTAIVQTSLELKSSASMDVQPWVSSVPWPNDNRLSDAKAWLSEDKKNKNSGLLKTAQFTSPQKEAEARKERAIRKLEALMAFWPEPVWSDVDKGPLSTFEVLVEHFSSCCGVCGAKDHSDCRSDPKREALHTLGWDPADQDAFCKDLLTQNLTKDKYKWPWDSRDDLSGDVMSWWTEIRRDAMDEKNPIRKDAINLWTGTGTDGAKFKAAYRHAEVCPGCSNCLLFRDSVRRGATFSIRRRALFAALLRSPSDELWGDIPRPKDAEIDAFMNQLDGWSGAAAPKKENQR